MVKEIHLTNKYKAVVIGGSAGSFQPMVQILSSIPREFPLPIFLCLHRLKHVRHGFVEALSIKSQKDIIEPMDKESIKKGVVYLAPANYHMAVELGNSVSLNTEELINNSRPAPKVGDSKIYANFTIKNIGKAISFSSTTK